MPPASDFSREEIHSITVFSQIHVDYNPFHLYKHDVVVKVSRLSIPHIFEDGMVCL